jgi:hypothetical protein
MIVELTKYNLLTTENWSGNLSHNILKMEAMCSKYINMAWFSCLWLIINIYKINSQKGKKIIKGIDCCLENLKTHGKSSKISPVMM